MRTAKYLMGVLLIGLAVAGCRGTEIEGEEDMGPGQETELIGQPPEDPATYELETGGGVDPAEEVDREDVDGTEAQPAQ